MLFGRAYANVHLCDTCEKIVLSWRLFIKSRRNRTEDPIVIPVNERFHKHFIALARKPNKNGMLKFDEEKLFVLTDEQFREYRERFRALGATEIATVIGAYQEKVLRLPHLN
jgi:hypothetical protein